MHRASIALVAVALVSCQSDRQNDGQQFIQPGQNFGGDFYIINTSGVDLDDVAVNGFERNPPCGVLLNAVYAGSHMHPMPLPKECVVTWLDQNGKRRSATLALANVVPKNADGELVIAFVKDGSVQVMFDTSEAWRSRIRTAEAAQEK